MQNKMWKNSKMESLLAKFSIWCNNKNNFNSSVTCTNNEKTNQKQTLVLTPTITTTISLSF